MTLLDYCEHDALGIAELVSKGEVTSCEVLDQALARAEAVNSKVNAIVHFMAEEAKATAQNPIDGPFHGVPFLLKDLNAAYAGFPMSHGSRLLKNFTCEWTDDIVKRYRNAGLVVFGKTNTSEFGILPVAEPDVFGPTKNPWNLGRTAGGSSGGAAAAVATGIVPIAHASDGGGSIRIPASCCGVFGFKPSKGLAPSGPNASELFFGYGTQHVISRSVRDSAAALDVIAQPHSLARLKTPSFRAVTSNKPQKRGLRIAVGATPYVDVVVDASCIAALWEAAHCCEDLGHYVEEAAPEFDRDLFRQDFFIVTCAGSLAALNFWQRSLGRNVSRPEIEVVTQLCRIIASNFSAAEFLDARDRLMSVQRRMETFLETFDVVLTPTLAIPPPELGSLRVPPLLTRILDISFSWPLREIYGCGWVIEQIMRRFPTVVYRFTPFAQLANVAGLPSMSVPLSRNSEGLPIGSMFTSAIGRDGMLLELASQLESHQAWRKLLPRC